MNSMAARAIVNARAYAGLHTLLTVHNIAYQGQFPASIMPHTGLHQRLFNHRQLEFYGQLNFLKSGCVFADRINTVSPRYAEEIQTMVFGCGLEGVLTERHNVLSGIVNGVDYYGLGPGDRCTPRGDVRCEYDLRPQAGKQAGPASRVRPAAAAGHAPVGNGRPPGRTEGRRRWWSQSAHELLSHDIQVVILGEGDPAVHKQLTAIRDHASQKLGSAARFDEGLAHRVEGGADAFLMPSQFEPSAA